MEHRRLEKGEDKVCMLEKDSSLNLQNIGSTIIVIMLVLKMIGEWMKDG